jgi:uncharacterized protein (DUF1697 family)
MPAYVAFLRGINVGGNKKILMTELTALFEQAGFRNIKTILNSGNVVFESKEMSDANIAGKVEKAIEGKFDFEVGIQIRSLDDIKKMVEKNPFKDYKPSKDTHWYVTFLNGYKGKLPEWTSEAYKFLSIQDDALFGIVYRNKGKSTDVMVALDKTFGKKVTTRNWNTIVKIANTR